MPLEKLLQRLVKASPGQKPFLSVYLDLRPDGSGKKLHTVFLKTRLPELSKLLPPHSREQSLLAQNVKRLHKYLEDELDPSWKGIALFTSLSGDEFLAVSMPVPPDNEVALASYPHLFSLLRQADLFCTYAVVVADSRQARLLLVNQGRLEKQTSLSWENKHTTRFGRLGWSLPKFQRHIQEHLKQRAKETVENLKNLIQGKKAEYLFMVAEEAMGAEMEKRMPSSLRKILAPLPSLDPHDPDHKILSGAFQVLQAISRKKAEELALQIIEEAQPLGRATTGPEPTLSALQNHQVERLVFDGRFKATGWRCLQCGFLGMGGSPRSCPLCQGGIQAADLREEMVMKAQSQATELFFTENFSPLLKVGAIAGWLKFKIPAKTQSQ